MIQQLAKAMISQTADRSPTISMKSQNSPQVRIRTLPMNDQKTDALNTSYRIDQDYDLNSMTPRRNSQFDQIISNQKLECKAQAWGIANQLKERRTRRIKTRFRIIVKQIIRVNRLRDSRQTLEDILTLFTDSTLVPKYIQKHIKYLKVFHSIVIQKPILLDSTPIQDISPVSFRIRKPRIVKNSQYYIRPHISRVMLSYRTSIPPIKSKTLENIPRMTQLSFNIKTARQLQSLNQL